MVAKELHEGPPAAAPEHYLDIDRSSLRVQPQPGLGDVRAADSHTSGFRAALNVRFTSKFAVPEVTVWL